MQILVFLTQFQSEKLTSAIAKAQNATHFHSRLHYVHPARGNTKNGTTGVLVRITTGRASGSETEGPENGTFRQKRDGWQP